jgi:hypothetical protein
VRQFLSTGIGKAIALAAIVAVWKYVSHPVALLLLVNYVRCSGMRESMENGSGTTLPANTHCPADYTYDNGQCKNASGGSVAAITCTTGETWDGTKCMGPTPPPSLPTPPSTSSTTMRQPFSNMTPSPIGGGVQPSMPEKGNFAPA